MISAELEDYYRECIVEHSRRPRNKGMLDAATHTGTRTHSERGESMRVHVRVSGETVEALSFEGESSAIGLASASMMSVRLAGKPIAQARADIATMRKLLDEGLDEDALLEFKDLAAFGGVRQFPARVQCALLAWEALEAALDEVEGK